MYPESKHGGLPGLPGGGKAPKSDIMSSFATDTANKAGLSSRTIQQEVQHEAMYPESKKGGNYGNQYIGGIVRQSEIISFSQDIATKTGLSSRTVRQEVQMRQCILGVKKGQYGGKGTDIKRKAENDIMSFSEDTATKTG